MRVLISTGEASGDAYGAALAKRIFDHSSDALIEGSGGPRMRDAGVALVVDSSSWGAIGIAQALRVAPRVVSGMRRIKEALRQGQPGLFVPIDFGFANIRLAREAKSRGWKVLYFVPPGSWRRDRQGADLAEVCNAVSTPFEWSADILRGMGVEAHWFGHPIKELIGSPGMPDLERQ